MACDGGIPCGRCIKREIAHLCREEPARLSQPPTPPSQPAPAAQLVPETSSNPVQAPLHLQQQQQQQQQPSSEHHTIDSNSMLNTLGLDIGAALRGGNGSTGGHHHNMIGFQGSMFEQTSPSYGDFNMALVSLTPPVDLTGVLSLD